MNNIIRDYIYSLVKENDIAIHCPNKEDIEELVEIMGEAQKWVGYYKEYCVQFCVAVAKRTGFITNYSGISWYKSNGYTIHEFADIKAKFATEQTLAELLGVEKDKWFEWNGKQCKIVSNKALYGKDESLYTQKDNISDLELIQMYLTRHFIKQDKTPQWSEHTKQFAKLFLAQGFQYVAKSANATTNVRIYIEKPERVSGTKEIAYCNRDSAPILASFMPEIEAGTCWTLKDIVGEE